MNHTPWGFALALTLSFFTANLALADYVPGEYVVKLKPHGFTALSAQNLGRVLGGIVKTRFEGDPNLLVLKKDASIEQEKAITDISRNPLVEYAEPNYIYKADKTPNDPDYAKMWGFHNTADQTSQPAGAVSGIDINIEKAWDITTGSKDVVVAVIDTGIDLTHPDLQGNIWSNEKELNGKDGVDDDGNGYVDDINGYNFNDDLPSPMDDNGHGTHVSGIIGGRGDDGIGIAGINWNVRLMACKFLTADGFGTLEGAIKAIDYATKMGAKVSNNSWGGGGYSQALEEAVKRASDAGMLFVAAAGNSAEDNDTSDTYPANFNVANILSVAAVDSSGQLANFSNWGAKKVHVAAPGVGIWSAYKEGGYKSLSGTSMATPHVTGLAALLLSKENLSVKNLKKRIMATTKSLDSLTGKVKSGGMIDAYKALTTH